MSVEARMRISLSAGEFEIEGPKDFIAKYDEIARRLLERLQESPASAFKSPESSEGAPVSAPSNETSDLPEFGEAVHRLAKNTSGTDQILVAGYYAATNHADQTFATAEASKLLVEQGIKVANPSQSLKNNLNAKKVFKVGSRYKISRDGIARVKELLKLS